MVTSKHQKAMATRSTAPRVAFGSCQKRLMFPTHSAPDRTGNVLHALRGSVELGPGCYDNHNVRSLVYDLQHKPESKRGYVLAARTAPRFLPPVKMTTPSPQKYQQDWSRHTLCSPGKAPFNSFTPRFRDRSSMMDSSPGGICTQNHPKQEGVLAYEIRIYRLVKSSHAGKKGTTDRALERQSLSETEEQGRISTLVLLTK